MKKCPCCELEVPKECSGQIEDHCTWCGTPMDPDGDIRVFLGESSIPPDKDRFCTLDCLVENDEWDKKITDG